METFNNSHRPKAEKVYRLPDGRAVKNEIEAEKYAYEIAVRKIIDDFAKDKPLGDVSRSAILTFMMNQRGAVKSVINADFRPVEMAPNAPPPSSYVQPPPPMPAARPYPGDTSKLPPLPPVGKPADGSEQR